MAPLINGSAWLLAYGKVLKKRVSNVDKPCHVATNPTCVATNDQG